MRFRLNIKINNAYRKTFSLRISLGVIYNDRARNTTGKEDGINNKKRLRTKQNRKLWTQFNLNDNKVLTYTEIKKKRYFKDTNTQVRLGNIENVCCKKAN